jgi:hypothetical protein
MAKPKLTFISYWTLKEITPYRILGLDLLVWNRYLVQGSRKTFF